MSHSSLTLLHDLGQRCTCAGPADATWQRALLIACPCMQAGGIDVHLSMYAGVSMWGRTWRLSNCCSIGQGQLSMGSDGESTSSRSLDTHSKMLKGCG